MTDPHLLRLVLNHLVSNALKFTEQDTVTVRRYAKDDAQVFEVSDTGGGFRRPTLLAYSFRSSNWKRYARRANRESA